MTIYDIERAVERAESYVDELSYDFKKFKTAYEQQVEDYDKVIENLREENYDLEASISELKEKLNESIAERIELLKLLEDVGISK